MAEQIIEATWEDLIRREDLRGRRLRVTVVDEARSSHTEPAVNGENAWVVRLREWAESHRRDLPLLSDEAISRESIYGDRGL